MSILTHTCPELPEEVEILVIIGQNKESVTTLVKLFNEKRGTYIQDTLLYGIKFCPYCGAKLVDEEPL